MFALKKDINENVKVELAEAAVVIKPYLDLCSEDAILLTEILGELLLDPCARVVEAAEQAEYGILTNRKKNKDFDYDKDDKIK